MPPADTAKDSAKSAASPAYTSYRQLAEFLQAATHTVAAPSFVIPGTVADNCRFLDGLFPQCSVLLFETEACLAYTDEDLPPQLADLRMDFHLHLPLDLPWDQGIDVVWGKLARLLDKTAFLSPTAYVLHPPPDAAALGALAARWTARGLDPANLLLENVEHGDLSDLLEPAHRLGLSLCLDLGHMLAYEQQFLRDTVDWGSVRMLHLCAPGQRGRHLPLTELDDEGRELLRTLIAKAPPHTVLTVEVFSEQGLMDSAGLLCQWLDKWEKRA